MQATDVKMTELSTRTNADKINVNNWGQQPSQGRGNEQITFFDKRDVRKWMLDG